MNPTVSICIPTFNGSEYIKEALDSSISQTYRPLEIIISDDNSGDSTLKIVESYKSLTDIPIYIFHHNAEGIGANWNNCVVNSSAKYIKFLFQDDLFVKNDCISKMVGLAESDSNIGLVFCRRKIIAESTVYDEWLKEYGNLHLGWTSLHIIQKGKHLLNDKKLLDSPLNKIGEPSCVLLKREVFSRVGFFNIESTQILDLEYWLRVFRCYSVGFVDDELVAFRRHKNQATEKKKQDDFPILIKSMLLNYFWLLNWRVKRKIILYLIKRTLTGSAS